MPFLVISSRSDWKLYIYSVERIVVNQSVSILESDHIVAKNIPVEMNKFTFYTFLAVLRLAVSINPFNFVNVARD